MCMFVCLLIDFTIKFVCSVKIKGEWDNKYKALKQMFSLDKRS